MNDARAQYGDIIDREHPDSPKHPRMPRKNRAAQFAPFAALTGYDDLINEAARYTERRIVLDENKKEELNRKLARLTELLEEGRHPEITVVYFIPDPRKPGGRYGEWTGRVKRLDHAARTLLFFQPDTTLAGQTVDLDRIAAVRGGELDAGQEGWLSWSAR